MNPSNRGPDNFASAKATWDKVPSMEMFYDRQGKPITNVERWAKKQEGQDGYKRVAETTIGSSWVSTVWVGVDMGFGMGPPLIFETLVFGGPLADEMERYATEAEALQGHERMVERVKEAISAGQDA